jgi:hypothetical protein
VVPWGLSRQHHTQTCRRRTDGGERHVSVFAAAEGCRRAGEWWRRYSGWNIRRFRYCGGAVRVRVAFSRGRCPRAAADQLSTLAMIVARRYKVRFGRAVDGVAGTGDQACRLVAGRRGAAAVVRVVVRGYRHVSANALGVGVGRTRRASGGAEILGPRPNLMRYAQQTNGPRLRDARVGGLAVYRRDPARAAVFTSVCINRRGLAGPSALSCVPVHPPRMPAALLLIVLRPVAGRSLRAHPIRARCSPLGVTVHSAPTHSVQGSCRYVVCRSGCARAWWSPYWATLEQSARPEGQRRRQMIARRVECAALAGLAARVDRARQAHAAGSAVRLARRGLAQSRRTARTRRLGVSGSFG